MPERRRGVSRGRRRDKKVRVRINVRLLAAVLAVGALGGAGVFYFTRTTFDEYVSRGDGYVAERRFPEAVLEYRNAVAKNSRALEVRRRLADALLEVPNVPAAAKEIEFLANERPEDRDLQLKAAATLLANYQFAEARLHAERVLKGEPGHVLGHILHANALAGQRKLDAAMAELQRAIEMDPSRPVGYADLAALEYVTGDLESAERNLRQAAALAPSDPETYLSLGSLLWSQNRLDEAEQAFATALRLVPRNVGANRALATLYLASGRAALAEERLKALADLAKGPEPLLALADFYLAQSRIPEATAILKSLVDRKEAVGEAVSRLASIAYAQGKSADAHRMIQETLTDIPTHPRLLLTLGHFLVIENKIEPGIDAVRKAVAADSNSADAHYTLGSLLVVREAHEEAIREFNEVLRLRPQSAAAKLYLARLHLTGGNPTLASQFARQTVKEKPDDLAARVVLLRSLVAEGDLDGAEPLAAALLTQAPQLGEAHWLTGAIQVIRKQPDRARKSFLRAIELAPDAYDPLEALVTLDTSTGNGGAARSLVEQRLRRYPDSAELLTLAARVYLAVHEPALAEQTLLKAVQKDAGARPAYELLGQLYLSQQRLDDARLQFEELGRRKPGLAAPPTMVGVIYQMQGRTEDAMAWYDRALALDPGFAIAANNLAWLHASRDGGDLEAALRHAQAANSRAPNEPTVSDTLGWIYLRKNLPELAIPLLRASVEKRPDNPLYRYHLGAAYIKAGDRDRGRESLERALAIKGAFAEAAEAKQLLASLD